MGAPRSVNLSPETLASPAFFDVVRLLGSDAHRLVVELTEHAELATYDEVLSRFLLALSDEPQLNAAE